MTSEGLQGLDIDWEENSEVVNVWCIGAHIHDDGAIPSEGIA